ncbi:DUF2715 domain-containing protein [Treponema sp. HNW]|uniref:DUF2715 domain-containing protein n=1 Tax=Treponema sp. HNW TaxID=3116654 RepID=UPI003D0E7291
MKRAMLIFIGVGLLCVNVCAEFVVSPTAGFSNLYSTEESTKQIQKQIGLITDWYIVKERNTITWVPFSFGVSLGEISKSGFTFLASTDFLTGSEMKAVHKYTLYPDSLPPYAKVTVKTKGLFLQGNLLFGYTYRGIPNLFLTAASGIGAGGGITQITEVSSSGLTASGLDIELKKADFGIPLYFGASYFFTKNIGINVGILDTIGAGWIWYDTPGLPSGLPYFGTGSDITSPAFTNVFTLKIGPIFKL